MDERVLHQRDYNNRLTTLPHQVSRTAYVSVSSASTRMKRVSHGVPLHRGRSRGHTRLKRQVPARTMASFFRFLTLLALHLFLDDNIDVVILEVGLGDRLDVASNAF